MSNSGLYEIRNIKNNKLYVGSSSNIRTRFRVHRRSLENNKHHNIKLQKAWNKDGEESFVFSILQLIEKNNLKEEEQKLLDIVLKNKPKCYNIAIDSNFPTRGRKATIKTKKRQSIALKKYFENPIARQKASIIAKALMANPIHKAKVINSSILARKKPEVRKRLSDSHKGIPQSEESRQKRSITIKALFCNPSFKERFSSIIASESVRQKMSDAKKKYFANPENRAKQSERTKSFFANPKNRLANSLRQIEYLKDKRASL